MNILTFDLEEWFHILDHESTKSEKDWSNYEYRLDKNIDIILELLQKYNQSATFFALGWLHKNHKHILKKVSSMGFEIGSHSMYHQLVYNQTIYEFEEDLKSSIYSIEDSIGKKVRIYRAPGFSVLEENRWFFEILSKYDIKIDCSIFPAKRAHGGFENFPYAKPVWIKTSQNMIKEFPMSTIKLFGENIVFSGGGYFRLIPLKLIDSFMKESNYVMTYFHPHDFDKDKPIIGDLSPLRKFKSSVGLKNSLKKLDRLINKFDFIDLDEAVKRINWESVEKIHLPERRKTQRIKQ